LNLWILYIYFKGVVYQQRFFEELRKDSIAIPSAGVLVLLLLNSNTLKNPADRGAAVAESPVYSLI
jgi:hypothetical protein